MGRAKGKGKRRHATGELAPLAERHEFTTGGLLGHDSGEYQVNVSERTALGVDAVYACVVRLADGIAGASTRGIHEYRGDERLEPPSRIVRRPMATLTRRSWLWLSVATMALYNVCYWRRLGEDAEGLPLSLVPIVPTRLSRTRDAILLDGRERVQAEDLVAVRRTVWPTVTEELGTVLKLAREVFAAAWAQGAYTADYWENGGAPQIIITTDQAITDPEAETIRDRFVAMRRDNPGRPAVIGKGGKVSPFGAELDAASTGTSGERILASVARFFGVQPWLVNAPSAAGSMVYQNTESAGLDLIRYTLDGYAGPIADAWSDQLPGDAIVGRRVDVSLAHLSQGTLLERYQAYRIALDPQAPFMTPEEVRQELRLPPDMGLLPTAGRPAPALEAISAEV